MFQSPGLLISTVLHPGRRIN
uniref:Uncharacterized protein n=1 Tax=Anguilla anguilla TaxID=7936 RepID=A0A0E9QM78_ANGAN